MPNRLSHAMPSNVRNVPFLPSSSPSCPFLLPRQPSLSFLPPSNLWRKREGWHVARHNVWECVWGPGLQSLSTHPVPVPVLWPAGMAGGMGQGEGQATMGARRRWGKGVGVGEEEGGRHAMHAWRGKGGRREVQKEKGENGRHGRPCHQPPPLPCLLLLLPHPPHDTYTGTTRQRGEEEEAGRREQSSRAKGGGGGGGVGKGERVGEGRVGNIEFIVIRCCFHAYAFSRACSVACPSVPGSS